MNIAVFNIKGEDTGRKAKLNDKVFKVEPNDHAIYLDVKQYLEYAAIHSNDDSKNEFIEEFYRL